MHRIYRQVKYFGINEVLLSCERIGPIRLEAMNGAKSILRSAAKGIDMTKAKIAAVIFGAMTALAGCASTQKVLDMKPVEVFHTERSQNEVAFCLANKNLTNPLDRDDGSKVVLLKNGWGGVSLAFTIRAEGSGSVVEYRRAFGTVGGIWRQCVGIKQEK